jgi:hypothetical protein
VIANGGLHAPWQVDAMMKVGAIAVGLGSVLWQVDPLTLFPEFTTLKYSSIIGFSICLTIDNWVLIR